MKNMIDYSLTLAPSGQYAAEKTAVRLAEADYWT
jgi:hypothetical protein